VGVHRGLSVVLLSNADTSGCGASLLRAEIAESIGRLARRANCRRLNRTERRAANNLRRGARVQGDTQISCEKCSAEERPTYWPLWTDPWGVL